MAVTASVLLALVQGLLLFCLAYQYVLALASMRRSPAQAAPDPCRTRFALAIPAHNEAAVLPATLAHLEKQDYPPHLFDVHIVADHCTDETAEVVRQAGGLVHERDCLPKGRKAYALQWLLDRILDVDPPYDAVAVFDADSLVDPGFLRAADGHLQAGAQVLQGQHIISNPQDSLLAAMAAVDMRLNNRLRNQSRRNLGLSCRLMGDAMAFDTRVLRAFGWQGESLTEDREYGYELLLRGIQVRYMPEARSYGQAAGSWKQAEPQRMRWYQGLVSMQRRLSGPLLRAALRSRSLVVLDGAIELLMPSFSFMILASMLTLFLVLVCGLFLPSVRGLLGGWASFLLVAAWGFYPLLGLIADRAPAWAFRALLLGPVYMVWRLWIALQVRLHGDRIAWVRTRRREEIDRAS